MVDLVTEILGGESPSPDFILVLLNLEKDTIQDLRPWQVLKKLQNNQEVLPSNLYTTSFNLPDDFSKFLLEGTLQLFDGNDDIQNISQVPYESQLTYRQVYGRFLADYGANLFYLMGLIPKIYQIWVWYIQTTPDITLGTTWEKFPSRYHKILCFGAAGRYRLGTDYDDVNARNADDNGKARDLILRAMEQWDTEMAISAINAVDYKNDNYPGVVGGRNSARTNYGPQGVRALN